jgi:hypothetical protein
MFDFRGKLPGVLELAELGFCSEDERAGATRRRLAQLGRRVVLIFLASRQRHDTAAQLLLPCGPTALKQATLVAELVSLPPRFYCQRSASGMRTAEGRGVWAEGYRFDRAIIANLRCWRAMELRSPSDQTLPIRLRRYAKGAHGLVTTTRARVSVDQ